MSNHPYIDAILKLDPTARYDHFIKRVADTQEVWSLQSDGWAMSSDGTGKLFMPVWPSKEFAELCATDDWEEYTPEMIELDEFLDDWVPGLTGDGYGLVVFPTPSHAGFVPDLKLFRQDMIQELERYE